MITQHFYDERTGTLTYVVYDEKTKDAVVIDPVMDYEPRGARVSDESAQQVAAFLTEHGLKLHLALDTHAHADHLSALPWFKDRYGCRTGIGRGIVTVQRVFKRFFHLGDDEVSGDGSQWDVLLADGEEISAGSLTFRTINTDGHTPASVSYLISDSVFVGDSLFQPDSGSARCDFPGGSAADLYDSIQKIYGLPDETKVYTLHDYQPGGRELQFMATVAEHKRANIHCNANTTKEEFVALRSELEQGKELPALILPSVQVNINGGRVPAMLKLPVNGFA